MLSFFLLYRLKHALLMHLSLLAHFFQLLVVTISVHIHVTLQSLELVLQLLLNVRHSVLVLLALDILQLVLLLPDLGLSLLEVVALLGDVLPVG